ncbi:unnamed protein product [Heterosigma akashiwo]
MVERRFRHLPVVDAKGDLSGIIDIAKCLYDAIRNHATTCKRPAGDRGPASESERAPTGEAGRGRRAMQPRRGVNDGQGARTLALPQGALLLRGKPKFATLDASIQEVADIMVKTKSAVLVVDDAGGLAGLVTPRDLLDRGARWAGRAARRRRRRHDARPRDGAGVHGAGGGAARDAREAVPAPACGGRRGLLLGGAARGCRCAGHPERHDGRGGPGRVARALRRRRRRRRPVGPQRLQERPVGGGVLRGPGPPAGIRLHARNATAGGGGPGGGGGSRRWAGGGAAAAAAASTPGARRHGGGGGAGHGGQAGGRLPAGGPPRRPPPGHPDGHGRAAPGAGGGGLPRAAAARRHRRPPVCASGRQRGRRAGDDGRAPVPPPPRGRRPGRDRGGAGHRQVPVRRCVPHGRPRGQG